jgi:hypothetical protein
VQGKHVCTPTDSHLQRTTVHLVLEFTFHSLYDAALVLALLESSWPFRACLDHDINLVTLSIVTPWQGKHLQVSWFKLIHGSVCILYMHNSSKLMAGRQKVVSMLLIKNENEPA